MAHFEDLDKPVAASRLESDLNLLNIMGNPKEAGNPIKDVQGKIDAVVDEKARYDALNSVFIEKFDKGMPNVKWENVVVTKDDISAEEKRLSELPNSSDNYIKGQIKLLGQDLKDFDKIASDPTKGITDNDIVNWRNSLEKEEDVVRGDRVTNVILGLKGRLSKDGMNEILDTLTEKFVDPADGNNRVKILEQYVNGQLKQNGSPYHISFSAEQYHTDQSGKIDYGNSDRTFKILDSNEKVINQLSIITSATR